LKLHKLHTDWLSFHQYLGSNNWYVQRSQPTMAHANGQMSAASVLTYMDVSHICSSLMIGHIQASQLLMLLPAAICWQQLVGLPWHCWHASSTSKTNASTLQGQT